ncbi:MAG: hypothetical protein Q4D65_00205 [Peptostreptococcaceae bacterium]|nr:hypothetical protein [Peptostreptococcaceae bacterium]
MKRKLTATFALAISMMLAMTACSKAPEQEKSQNDNPSVTETDKDNAKSDTESEDILDKKEFEKNFNEQNQTLQNVHFQFDGDYLFFGTQSYVKLDSLYFYDPQTLENTAYYVKLHTKDPKKENSGETIHISPGGHYVKWEGEKDWTKGTSEGDLIDYHGFSNILQKIMREDPYELKKTESGYEVLVNDKNFDLLGTFKGELDFWLKGIDQTEVDKEVIFLIDEETFYIKEISVDMNHQANDVKTIKTHTKIIATEHNQVDLKMLEKIYAEAEQ